MKINISIDKLSLIFDIHNDYVLCARQLFEKYFNTDLSDQKLKSLFNSKAHLISKEDGSSLFVNTWSTSGLQKIKFDFNPAKINTAHFQIVQAFKALAMECVCSRIDIAFDIPKNLSEYHINESPSKKYCNFHSRRGIYTGSVFGAKTSEKRIRVYDKGMEQNSSQKENSSYWRVEYQLRKREVNKLLNSPKYLLKGLSIISNYNINSLPDEEQLIAYALIHNKSFYQTLKNSYQRDKWKKKLNSLRTEDLQPFIEDEWNRYCSRTIDEVRKWMSLIS